jgi:hypothetical protein
MAPHLAVASDAGVTGRVLLQFDLLPWPSRPGVSLRASNAPWWPIRPPPAPHGAAPPNALLDALNLRGTSRFCAGSLHLPLRGGRLREDRMSHGVRRAACGPGTGSSRPPALTTPPRRIGALIIALAKAGERNAERLCQGALQAGSPVDPSDRPEGGSAAES